MAGKSIEERLLNIEKKQKQLQVQKQILMTRNIEIERKERTRKMIQIGSTFHSIGVESLEQANAFKKALNDNEKIRIWFEKLMAAHAAADTSIEYPTQEEFLGDPETKVDE